MRSIRIPTSWLPTLIGAAIWSGALLAAIVGVRSFGTLADQNVALSFLVNLAVVLGLQVFGGNSGIMSFGHVGLMALATYTAALMTTDPLLKVGAIPNAPDFIVDAHFGWIPGMLIAVGVTAVFAAIVGIPIVRLSGAAAAVGTLGLLVIVFVVFSNYEEITRGAKAYYGAPAYTTLYRAVAVVAVAILVARIFRDSRIGLGLRSSRQDILAARASGVHVARYRLVAWTLSAGVVALGGSLYAGYIPSLTPKDFFFDLTFIIVTMLIVGGSSVSAAVVGATIVTVMTEVLRRLESGFAVGPLEVNDAPGLSTIAVGLLIVLTMILRPQGIFGRWELDELLLRGYRRLAARRRARGVSSEVEAQA
jgi:branched-chain amino acid transport system permease protein